MTVKLSGATRAAAALRRERLPLEHLAVAHVEHDAQVPGAAREAAARVLGLPEAAVTVHVTYLGGGFGRRLEVDFIAQAARVALECGGAPVQLVWSREEDMTHDFYRPAGAAVLQAGLDAAGKPVALSITNAGDALVPRWLARIVPKVSGLIEVLTRNGYPDSRAPAALTAAGDAPDKTAAEGRANRNQQQHQQNRRHRVSMPSQIGRAHV